MITRRSDTDALACSQGRHRPSAQKDRLGSSTNLWSDKEWTDGNVLTKNSLTKNRHGLLED